MEPHRERGRHSRRLNAIDTRTQESAMDFSLSEEQREMVDTVRKLRHEQLAPNAMKWLNGDFPWENMKSLGEIGVLGMAVPQEYGGMDASVLDTVLVLEEISKACYATALAVLGEIGV